MSQGTYKITEAQQGRTYTGKYGENTVWLVRLENAEAQSANGMFELHKKAGATIQPGQEIEVERFIEGEFDGASFVRIKQVFNQSSGGGGSSYQGKSPDQQRSIVRQHSQEMALRFIAATGDVKDMNLSDPTVVGAYLSGTVKRLTDWFAADAMAASQSAAVPQSQPALTNGGGEVPADTAGLTPAPVGVDDSVPF